MDGVLANFLKAACAMHNRPYEPKEITQFDVAEVWGISASEFWSPLSGQEFWENLEPYEWAKDLYEGLKEVAPVTILTAPSRDPGCIPGKIAWLERHLGIKSYDVIPTGQKHLLARNRLCYLIDDSPEKCKKFEAYGGTPLVFYQPWNNWNGSGHECNDWQTVLDVATRLIRLEQHFSKAA
jgi:5'(3')-deoxyribonucleotidase